VLVFGSCHAPEGRPVPLSYARVRVAPTEPDPQRTVDKKLFVFGDRYWKDGVLGKSMTDPIPFTTMPLGWERAFGGETWKVAPTADALIAAGTIPPIVIAGVDHGGDARVREYTPTADGQPGAGQVGRHARFLTEEVVPFLARQYAVRTDVDGLGLGGASLGGLATVGVALAAPGRFGRLIVMSPSVWWDRRAILRQLRRTPLEPRPRTWVDVGLKEGAKTVRDARDLVDRLDPHSGGSRDGPPADDRNADQVRFVIDPEGDHSERSWARRFGAALAFCFAT